MPTESAARNAARNSGDSDLRRTAVVGDTQVLKTDGESAEPPVMPLQDKETMNVFIFLKIVSVVWANTSWQYTSDRRHDIQEG